MSLIMTTNVSVNALASNQNEQLNNWRLLYYVIRCGFWKIKLYEMWSPPNSLTHWPLEDFNEISHK